MDNLPFLTLAPSTRGTLVKWGLMNIVRIALALLCLYQHIAQAESPRVVVVGAGLAGLTAAYRLQRMSIPVEVYEARSRPGGRCLTAYFGSAYEELGGKSFEDAPDPVHIRALTTEFGLEEREHQFFGVQWLGYDNELIPLAKAYEGAPAPTPELYSQMRRYQACARNLDELISLTFADCPLLARLLKGEISGFESSPTSRLAVEYLDESLWPYYAISYARANQHGGGSLANRKHHVAGGNSVLVQALANSLRNAIQYNHPLRSISRCANGRIALQFADNLRVDADYVILTLPCSTLRDVYIESGLLPEDQLHAIQELPYGTAAKLLVPICAPAGEAIKSFQTDRTYSWFNSDNTVMTIWYIADAGILTPGDPKLEADIERHRQVYPHITFPSDPQPVALFWANEEYSKGSYCTHAPGQFALYNEMLDEYGEKVRKVFRSVEGKLFFAGEHTADIINTLDGAVQSGERAARMLGRAITQRQRSAGGWVQTRLCESPDRPDNDSQRCAP